MASNALTDSYSVKERSRLRTQSTWSLDKETTVCELSGVAKIFATSRAAAMKNCASLN